MSKKKQKSPKVEEVSVDVVAEEAIDALTPDAEETEVQTEEVDVEALNAEAEVELSEAEKPEDEEEPEVTIEVVEEDKKPLRCVGHHPITKEKVYR
jgi:hypothetical protein